MATLNNNSKANAAWAKFTSALINLDKDKDPYSTSVDTTGYPNNENTTHLRINNRLYYGV